MSVTIMDISAHKLAEQKQKLREAHACNLSILEADELAHPRDGALRRLAGDPHRDCAWRPSAGSAPLDEALQALVFEHSSCAVPCWPAPAMKAGP